MPLNLFARNLRHLRKQKRLTQEALGKKIFVSRTLIAHMEKERRSPNLETLERICELFQTDLTTIIKKQIA